METLKPKARQAVPLTDLAAAVLQGRPPGPLGPQAQPAGLLLDDGEARPGPPAIADGAPRYRWAGREMTATRRENHRR